MDRRDAYDRDGRTALFVRPLPEPVPPGCRDRDVGGAWQARPVPEPPFLARVQTFYDELAPDYHGRMCTLPADQPPIERAVLGAFAEHVRASGGGVLGDLGCGAGHVAAHLVNLGLEVVGLDLTPAMLTLAQVAHPALRLVRGSLTALPLADGSLAGALVYYSLIHIPPGHRAAVLAELARVVAPGGHVLLGFQVGTDVVHVSAPDGRPVSLGVHRLDPDDVTAQLADAGFACTARVIRQAVQPERTPQAYLLAGRAG